MSLLKLKEQGEAPEWMTEEAHDTLTKGYLLPNETPKQMYKRVAEASACRLDRPDLAPKFFDIIWKNWLCLATPVACNMGTSRGLPISCFGQAVEDSVDGIFKSYHEVAMLSKNGGGIGTYYGGVRGRGVAISGNGKSEGIIPWLKILDSTMLGVAQGGVRRGSAAVYLEAEHPDFPEFLQMRKPTGDVNRQCLNLHHAANLSDEFMSGVGKDKTKSQLWSKILETRFTTGEPYLFFKDNTNKQNPQCYKDRGLDVKASQLCNEIMLHSDKDHTYVCCLSSMNAARFDEWKDTDAVELSIWFLDGVMQEFIDKAKVIPGFEKAVRFSEKSRALGLGVLGWHTYLQQKGFAFDSFEGMMQNSLLFKTLRDRAEIATRALAETYGEVEWTKGSGRRNTHLLAIAPTVSNSVISGGVSSGIEPISANIFALKTAKGVYIRKNPTLQAILKERNMDTPEIWAQINKDQGSVQDLTCLSEEEKKVFLTAREINQFALVKQAAQRQKFIDQGQSLNLFFTTKASPKYVHEVHYMAWEMGLKGLYYLRSESVLKGDSLSYKSKDECASCHG